MISRSKGGAHVTRIPSKLYFSTQNWLEKDCYGSPNQTKDRNCTVGNMIRSTYVSKVILCNLIDGQMASLNQTSKEYQILKEFHLQNIPTQERLKQFMVKERVRPSLLLPIFQSFAYCSGQLSAKINSTLSFSLLHHIKHATSEQCNDSVRDILSANMNNKNKMNPESQQQQQQQHVELKEILKQTRDQELNDVHVMSTEVEFHGMEHVAQMNSTMTKFCLTTMSKV